MLPLSIPKDEDPMTNLKDFNNRRAKLLECPFTLAIARNHGASEEDIAVALDNIDGPGDLPGMRECQDFLAQQCGQWIDFGSFFPMPAFSCATRPDPESVGPGFQIWNTDDRAPNYSDGVDWRDATGLLT